MTKKRHPKPRTNSNSAPCCLHPSSDRERQADDFRHLFDLIWTRLLELSPGDRDNIDMMQAVVCICKLGWNIATDDETPKGIEKQCLN